MTVIFFRESSQLTFIFFRGVAIPPTRILLALLAARGASFGLHTDLADADRISEALLGVAGRGSAHILEQHLGTEQPGAGVAFLC